LRSNVGVKRKKIKNKENLVQSEKKMQKWGSEKLGKFSKEFIF
jgi:hypothetical protein